MFSRLPHSVEDYTDGYMQALAMVNNTGYVFWPPIVKFESTCQIDITYFPFDDQVCEMKLGSWAYDGLQVRFSIQLAHLIVVIILCTFLKAKLFKDLFPFQERKAEAIVW